MSGRLPANQQKLGRQIGLMMALVSRILLLLSLTWIMRLVEPLFTVVGNEISGRDLILLVGGLFLLAKSTIEMHHSLEGSETHVGGNTKKTSFWGTIAQIAVLDIVFSLDSVITAVGLSDNIAVMIVAIMIAVLVMLVFSEALSGYIETPHHQDFGVVVPFINRYVAGSRRVRLPYRKRLHLLCDGIFGHCRTHQHSHARQSTSQIAFDC